MWSDWLVVCDCSFSLSALWSPLSVLTVLLGFLLPWMWGLSSWLLQQSAAAAPYLSFRVAPLSRARTLSVHCSNRKYPCISSNKNVFLPNPLYPMGLQHDLSIFPTLCLLKSAFSFYLLYISTNLKDSGASFSAICVTKLVYWTCILKYIHILTLQILMTSLPIPEKMSPPPPPTIENH